MSMRGGRRGRMANMHDQGADQFQQQVGAHGGARGGRGRGIMVGRGGPGV
jgi:hypothetical protein